jgi:hypothetical protein
MKRTPWTLFALFPASTRCRLPAAQAVSSQDALQVLKVAVACEGRLLARRAEEYEKVFHAFAPLAERLTETDAVELFRHADHYRWAMCLHFVFANGAPLAHHCAWIAKRCVRVQELQAAGSAHC